MVQRIALSVDDRLVFTSDQAKPQLAVIDTATRKIKTGFHFPELDTEQLRRLTENGW